MANYRIVQTNEDVMTIQYISIYLNKIEPQDIPPLDYSIDKDDIILSYNTNSDKFRTFSAVYYNKSEELFCNTAEEFMQKVEQYKLMNML